MSQTKIGVMTPTYNRPDLARFTALQMGQQSMAPAILCMHQNGTGDSYQWAVEDIDLPFDLVWLHSPEALPQDQWYLRPLRHLLEQGCTHFFWCDHDDIYSRRHIENGMAQLALGYDHVVNAHSNVLYLNPREYAYSAANRFRAHAPGGMSSSMCFNRAFAQALEIDLQDNRQKFGYSDEVVARVTMPKFRCQLREGAPTTTYVCHKGAVSSSMWIQD